MLLEYSEDTDELKVHDRALQLRQRVAGRQLQAAIKLGNVDDSSLLYLKERNRDEKRAEVQVELNLVDAEAKDRVAMGRAEQQLLAEGQVRSLARDLSRATKLSKARMDTLTDLERRVTTMRTQLKGRIKDSADILVNRELRTNDKLMLERKFSECTYCNRKILVELIDTHQNMCQKNPRNDRQAAASSSSVKLSTMQEMDKQRALVVQEEPPLASHGISNHREDTLSLPKVFDVDYNLVTALATYVPGPVRNCRLKSKGISFIEWEWDAPVFKGGLEITNYEISFHGKFQEFDKETGKWRKWEEDYPSLLTSTWLLKDNPVCHKGFKITGLRGGAEYSRFKVRCCNLRGWSEWTDMLLQNDISRQRSQLMASATEHSMNSDNKALTSSASAMNLTHDKTTVADTPSKKTSLSESNHAAAMALEKVVTDNPVAPSAALFVNADKVTSTCIHISWSAPIFSGGLPLAEYVVEYTVRERVITVTARDVIVDKRKSFRVPARIDDPLGIVTAVIRNVPDDTDVLDVVVCAVNRAGLIGTKGPLKQPLVRTTKSSRFTQLTREFDLAAKSQEPFIDTAFFTNVRQRISRIDHMRQLKEELEVTPPDPDELQEAKEWEAIVVKVREAELALKAAQAQLNSSADSVASSMQGADAALHKLLQQHSGGDSGDFTYTQRRRHFQHKIKQIEGDILAMNSERMQIDRVRLTLTNDMRKKEARLLDISIERDRLKNYRGAVITSDVLTGADIQYKTVDYVQRVEKAYQQVIQEIANLKFKVISGENRRREIKDLLVVREEERKIKLAQFLEFEKKAQKTINLIKRLNVAQASQSSTGTGSTDEMNEEERANLLRSHFDLFIEYVDERKATRMRIVNLFHDMMGRLKKQGFDRWKLFLLRALQADEKTTEAQNNGQGSDSQLVAVNGNDGHKQDSKSKSKHKKSPGSKSASIAAQIKAQQASEVISVGGRMLETAFERRLEFQDSLREMINSTAIVGQKLTLSKLSKDARTQLTSLRAFKSMEEGIDHKKLYIHGLKLMYEADGYVKEGRFELALSLYDAQIIWIRSRPGFDIKLLAICHGRLGRMFLYLGKSARAIVEFDRQLSLAREISDKVEESDAFSGLGEGYLSVFDYENAVRYLTIAQAQYHSMHRVVKYKHVLNQLKTCYERMNRPDKVEAFTQKIDMIDEGMALKIRKMHAQLDDMKSRLFHTAAEIEMVIPVERTTIRALELKHMIKRGDEKLKDLNEEMKLQEESVSAVAKLLDAIQEEMSKALASDESEMWSELVHDQPQIVEIEELKTRLKARSIQELQHMQREESIRKQIAVRISNAENEVLEADQQLAVEEGNLMKHSHTSKPFRCVGLCTANAAGNEVTGTATGGQEEFSAAEGIHIHLIDYHNGELKHIFAGGKESTGHVGAVTCLLLDGQRLFSGSTDERIICWDIEQLSMVRILHGHEGSIVAMAAEAHLLASSSSDNTIRLWNKVSGDQLRVVFGHSKSVLSLEIGKDWMLTGSADHEARLWKITYKNQSAEDDTLLNTIVENKTAELDSTKRKKDKRLRNLAVDCITRLQAHQCPVTCVKYGSVEIVTADQQGRIFVWWMKTGEVIRQCQAHDGPVRALQFDAVHIVSCGVDGVVTIVDIATGEVLQKLRGHKGPVLAMAFDSDRILSVGSDNVLRYWQWGKQSGPRDKEHVIAPGETLAQIAKKNGLSIDILMKWNGIRNASQATQGKKLIVKKGDPNQLTVAEKLVEEQELKRLQATQWAAKKMEKMSAHSQHTDALMSSGLQLPSHDPFRRVKHLATDMDFFSLGNRMFGDDKRRLDLFPDESFLNSDRYSLAGRLQQNASETEERLNPTLSKREKKYFITESNEDEWGPVASSLGFTMLDMLIELLAYELVVEQKKQLRSKQTVLGRIFTHQQVVAEAEKKKKQQDKLRKHTTKGKLGNRSRSGSDSDGDANDEDADMECQILHTIGEEEEEFNAKILEETAEPLKEGDEDIGEDEVSPEQHISKTKSVEERELRAQQAVAARNLERQAKKEKRKARHALNRSFASTGSEVSSDEGTESWSLPNISHAPSHASLASVGSVEHAPSPLSPLSPQVTRDSVKFPPIV